MLDTDSTELLGAEINRGEIGLPYKSALTKYLNKK